MNGAEAAQPPQHCLSELPEGPVVKSTMRQQGSPSDTPDYAPSVATAQGVAVLERYSTCIWAESQLFAFNQQDSLVEPTAIEALQSTSHQGLTPVPNSRVPRPIVAGP